MVGTVWVGRLMVSSHTSLACNLLCQGAVVTVESWWQEVNNGRIFSKMVPREEVKIVCLKM